MPTIAAASRDRGDDVSRTSLPGRHLDPRVEHRGNHVLAEVVQVALDRAQDHERGLRVTRLALGEQDGLDDLVALLEHRGRRDDLGQEDLAALPHLAEVEHRHGHALLEDHLRVDPRVDEALSGTQGRIAVGPDQGPPEKVEVFGHVRSPVVAEP
jgi:hypothetical protein